MLKLLKQNNKNITIVLSIIWGLGLASIFRKVCNKRECINYKAPDPNSIINNIWKIDNKCYSFKNKNTKCVKNTIK